MTLISGKAFEQKGEFVAGGLFVVDDDGVDGHGFGWVEYRLRAFGAIGATCGGSNREMASLSGLERLLR